MDKRTFNKVNRYLKKENLLDIDMYYDYNDSLSDKQISQIINGELNEIECQILEWNENYFWQERNDRIRKAFEHLDIEATDDNMDYVRDNISFNENVNIEELIKRHKVNVRIQLQSNYDCINSSWLEHSAPISYKHSYFGAAIDALNFNPHCIKNFLESKGLKTEGKWPDLKDRTPLIDINQWWTEEENRSCGANLLTIVGTLPLVQFVNGQKPKKILIPKGNPVGFFSSFQGGGSPFEAKLQRDLIIDLTKKKPTEYDYWHLVQDEDDGYSIDSVYGVTREFWGDEITVKQFLKS